MFGPEFIGNPHDYWTDLRRKGPITWAPHVNSWLVLGYAAALDVFRDERLGTAAYAKLRPSPVPVPSSFELGKAENQRLRRLIASRLGNGHWSQDGIRKASESIQRTVDREVPIDFVTDYAEPMARLLVRNWLGLDDLVLEDLLTSMGTAQSQNAALSSPAAQRVIDLLREEIRRCRVEPRRTLLSDLSIAWAEAQADDLDLIAFLGPVIFSLVRRQGTRLLVHTVLALVEHPDIQLAIRHGGFETARGAALEAARWEPVNQVVPRTAQSDLHLADQCIARGDTILIVLSAVCRDGDHHPDPAVYRLGRKESSLAFGARTHGCLGRELSLTVVAGVLVELLVDKGLTFHATSNANPAFSVEFGRACTSLPVILSGEVMN